MNNNRQLKCASGFTLIEVMIALTVGLFILGAVSAVAINSARSSRANDRTSELQSNGRYALDVIRRDVQHAGQTGLTPAVLVQQGGANNGFSVASGVSVTNDCGTQFAVNLAQPLIGSDDSNPYSATCIPSGTNTSWARGDVLAVRYADMSNAWTVAPAAATSAPSAALTNDVYFRSSFAVSQMFQKGGVSPTQLGAGPMQDQLLRVYVYYISANTTGADGIPALYRVSLNAGAMAPELVVSGIENLQVRYGVVDATNNTQYLDAGAVTAANSWPQVQSLRIWLLARNSSTERGEAYSNQTTYQMGNVSFVPAVGTNDQYRRQLYITTVNMRN